MPNPNCPYCQGEGFYMKDGFDPRTPHGHVEEKVPCHCPVEIECDQTEESEDPTV